MKPIQPLHANLNFQFHWVRTAEAEQGEPMEWDATESKWFVIGSDTPISPDEAADLGWVYLLPARIIRHKNTRKRPRR